MFRALKLILSVFNLVLAAKYFGGMVGRDIWVLALNCIVVLDAAIWGPVNETFRAKFVSMRAERGEEYGLVASGALFTVTLLFSMVLTLFLALNREIIASVIAPDFSGQDHHALAAMIMLLAPSLLFNQGTQLGIGILNAYGSFYVPEVASCIATVVNICTMSLFAPSIGIYSLALGYYVGLILLSVLLFRQFRKRRIALLAGIRQFKMKLVTPFIVFALPFFVPFFFAQLNHVVEKSLASTMGVGVVSSLDYARKIPDVFLTVITSVLTTILVPVLAQLFSSGMKHDAFKDFKKILQLGMLIIALLVCVMSTSAKEIITLLYDQGSITDAELSRISSLTTYYSLASVTVFLYLLFGLTLLAQHRGKTYALIGLFAQLGMITTNILLYRKFGPAVFPFGLFISHFIAAVILFTRLPFDKYSILSVLFKYTCILLIGLSATYLTAAYIDFGQTFLQLVFNGSVAALYLYVLLYVFRAEEGRLILDYLKKMLETLQKK